MKLFVYAYYNQLGGFFGQPFVDKNEPGDMAQELKQALICLKDDKTLDHLKEEDLFKLGVYDNITGDIIYEKEFVCHCSDIVVSVAKLREHKESV